MLPGRQTRRVILSGSAQTAGPAAAGGPPGRGAVCVPGLRAGGHGPPPTTGPGAVPTEDRPCPEAAGPLPQEHQHPGTPKLEAECCGADGH